ncbi:hypothetical protein DYB26_004703 [Aphanomyces astaci]|uniref:Uncharacterized protein n=1 Tax=Aphanomyces astaci TaxID=112090 RepID=A0A3R6YB14_APHAT|nr:hypothetical protein DYB26_004703 [Aphanomyces astaci]
MEYRQNKHHPAMLLKLAVLYVELEAWQGALALCTLVLESTKWNTFSQFNEAVFLSGAVAIALHHATQSGEYFAYLAENPPHNLRSYRVLLLAGMQLDSQPDSPDAVERSRVLYVEAYNRLTGGVRIPSPTPSEAAAMELYHTSRKSESERIQLWLADPNVWDSFGMDLFDTNHPFLASLTFEYALRRGGCRSVETLVTMGRVHHRLKRTDKAELVLEQALRLDYYAHPTRFWLGVVSFRWSQHFKREVRGAVAFQRVYRGHCACVWLEKVRSVSRIYLLGRTAKRVVAIRKAAELAREAVARDAMHDEDWFLVFLRWNAAARSIQSLLPIARAKRDKIARRAWLHKHKALLRRVVSHSNDRLVQTCFAAIVEFVVVARQDQHDAAVLLQRAARKWLGRRHLARLAAKHAEQQKLLVVFLGKANKRWKADCFFAWRTCRERTKSLRRASALRIQCAYRSFKARQVLRANMARQVRVRQFMAQLVVSRDGLCMRKTFHSLAVSALAARLHKHACATRIQKIMRGRFARALVVRVRKRHRHCEGLVATALEQRAGKFVAQLWTTWQLFVQLAQLEKQLAATHIQRMERGRAARRRVRIMREYLHVYFGQSGSRLIPLPGNRQLRLVFVGLWKHRKFRTEREDKATRTIQRAVRRCRHRRQARHLREKLKRKMQVATMFQKTFHAAATAFFHVLKGLCDAKHDKLDVAARVLQRNLRGWLARRVMARLAKQHRAATALLDRVIHREARAGMGMVLRLWKAGLVVCREVNRGACVTIQRRFRARRAIKEARMKMDKRRRQRQLVERGTGKPLVRYFHMWQSRVIESAASTFNASLTAKHTKQFTACSSHVLDTLAWMPQSPVQKLILFNEPAIDGSRLAACLDRPKTHPLVSVVVGGSVLPSRHVMAIALSLAQPHAKLQQLVLDSCRVGTTFLSYLHGKRRMFVGNTGAVLLAMGLAHNKSVWKVDLSGNGIGDVACQALGELLLANDTLQVRLVSTKLITYGAPLFSLPAASALAAVYLHGNPTLTRRGLDALQSAAAFVNHHAHRSASNTLVIEGG